MERSEFIIEFNKATSATSCTANASNIEESEKYPSRRLLAGCKYLKNIGLIYHDDMLGMLQKVMKPAFQTSDAAAFVYDYFKEYIPQLEEGVEITVKKTYYWKCAKCYPYQYENDIRVLSDNCRNTVCEGKIVADVFRVEKVVKRL